jgi:hypothetical protein
MKCSLFTFHTRYQTLLSIKRRMLGSWIFFWEVKVGLVVRLITFFNNVYSYSRGASCYFLSKSCVRCVWYTVRWFWKTVTALLRLHPIRLMTASDQKYCYSISQCIRGAFRWLKGWTAGVIRRDDKNRYINWCTVLRKGTRSSKLGSIHLLDWDAWCLCPMHICMLHCVVIGTPTFQPPSKKSKKECTSSLGLNQFLKFN